VPAQPLEFLCPHDDVGALNKESVMLDFAYIAVGVVFFAVSAGYALVCERL